jgi:TM2 domain-containing membrane protein YozV
MTDDASRSGQNIPSTEIPSGAEPPNLSKGAEAQSQQGSVSPWAAAQDAASSAGQAAQNAFQGGMNSVQAQGDIAQKKLIAGLLGIFLGSLGVHKFYLGNTQPAIIMLACTLGGWVLGIIGSFIIVGAILFVLPWVMGVIGLVEGIVYLTKSDADFQREYVVGKKAWF